jgi:hypothetical protein
VRIACDEDDDFCGIDITQGDGILTLALDCSIAIVDTDQYGVLINGPGVAT